MDTRIILAVLGVATIIRVSLASLPKIHKIELTGLKVSVDLRVDNTERTYYTQLVNHVPGLATRHIGKPSQKIHQCYCMQFFTKKYF